MEKPTLRAVRGFPVQIEGRQAIGLSDARQVTDKVVFVPPQVQMILPLMNGERTLEEIVSAVGRGLTREAMESIVAQLDHAGLLIGPTFDAILAKMRQDFDSSTTLPPASTANMADQLVALEFAQKAQAEGRQPTPPTEEQKAELGPARLKAAMDAWIAKALENAENPAFDELPKAVVAPHIDYGRGWINYAHVWGRLRVADRPDRVIILGTNHFGTGTGVVGCDKGFASPLGACEPDTQLIDALRARLGPQNAELLFKDRYDHEREHSIELQIPWIQHCLGAGDDGKFPRVFGALIHDPTVNNGESYDGKGLALDPFVDALREVVGSLPGRTLIVSSADLSHAGPAFGDQQPLAGEGQQAEQARTRVFEHDREMLELVNQLKVDDLLASMSWQQNPTRWCSIGNIVAAVRVAQPSEAELLNYSAAMDEQGLGLVSSAAMAMR
jgi:predicted class III extradiol MEMO1 family dioxygenase